jgi:hypothetical protein
MHDFVGSDDPANQLQMQDGSNMNYLPVKKVSVPVDVAFVIKNGIVEAKDSVSSEIRFDLPKDILMKNDLTVLNIIAANKWARPIYFTSPFGELGFGQYLRSEGQSYRLVPVADPTRINTRASYDIIKNKFAYGNANIPGVYFDEENRRHLMGIRQSVAEAAGALVNEGQNEKAKEILNLADKNILEENFPYGMVSRQNQHNTISVQLLEAAYKSGDKKLGAKIANSLTKDLQQQLSYYAYLGKMTVAEMTQAVQDLMANKADNLANSQKNLFMDIRQSLMLMDYVRGLEATAK